MIRSCKLLLLIIIFIACKQSTATHNNISEATSFKDNSVNRDSADVVGVFKNFIHWYKDNYKSVNNVVFVGDDKRGNYMVNKKECDKFLQNLANSGYISKKYVTEWNKYFESKSAYFKENPMNEGPPEGFDYDLVLLTQEPELVWEAIDTIKFEVSIDKNQQAKVTIGGGFGYEIEMSKEQHKWKIDYISTLNYD